jgi:prolipoprotein diacylglyceryltransferase
MTYFLWWTLGAWAGATTALVLLWWRGHLRFSTGGAIGVAWAGLYLGAVVQYRLEIASLADAVLLTPDRLMGAGMRLPLGMLIGGIFAVLWCLAWRERIAPVADAVALGAAVITPIGRIGCITNGCCLGAICPAWASSVCFHAPHGAFGMDAATSPEIFPLAWAFLVAGCSLAIVAGVVSLRARRAGMVAVLICTVGPATKALLEQFRAVPRPEVPSVWMPLGVSLLVLLALAAARWGARREQSSATDDTVGGSLGPDGGSSTVRGRHRTASW